MALFSKKPSAKPKQEGSKESALRGDAGTAHGPSQEALASQRAHLALGEIVSLLLRSPNFQSAPLSAIAAVTLPAISSGQFVLARAKTESGATAPVGVCVWANVSTEVDRRLSQDLDQPMRLAPHEWKSGDTPWIIACVGEPRIVNPMLQRIQKTTLKGRPLKMRIRGGDGVTSVRTFRGVAASNTLVPEIPL